MTVHPGAMVADDARIDESADIGPFTVIGFDPADETEPVTIGADCTVRSHAVLYRATTIGIHVHIGHGAMVREHTSVADHVSIGTHSIVEHHVILGEGVRLHSRCFVPEHSVLEPGAWLGPGVTVTNARYPNQPDTKGRLEGVIVRRGARIGAAVVLLPGVVIGEGALIGAGAVVVRDVAPGATVVGNPARELS